jgi:hypothetical protein
VPSLDAGGRLSVTTPSQAGYYLFAADGSPFREVAGSWTVPAISCPSASSATAIWVGLDDNNARIEQAGTMADCLTGVAHYWFFSELGPDAAVPTADLALAAGDQVSASVTFSGADTYTLSLRDLSSGAKRDIIAHVSASRVRAEWIVEAPAPGFLLAPFGSLTFTKLTAADDAGRAGGVNGAGWTPVRADLVAGGVMAAQTDPASGSGSSFVVRASAH